MSSNFVRDGHFHIYISFSCDFRRLDVTLFDFPFLSCARLVLLKDQFQSITNSINDFDVNVADLET